MSLIQLIGGDRSYTSTGTSTSIGKIWYSGGASQVETGDLIFVIFSYQKSTGGAFVSITDTLGHKWRQLRNSPYSSTPDTYVGLYYTFAKQNFSSGSSTITAAATSATKWSIAYILLRGVSTNASIDVQSFTSSASATTNHTGPAAADSDYGVSLLCIGDDSYGLSAAAPTVTVPTSWVPFQSNGWTYIGAGSTANFVGIYRYFNISGGAIAAPTWTTSTAACTCAWLINIRQKIPSTKTEGYSFDFTGLSDSTNYTNPRFLIRTINTGIRLDSGVATANVSGGIQVLDLNTVYTSGTIGSKTTIKGAKGNDADVDGTSMGVFVNCGSNMWNGYRAYINSTYAKISKFTPGETVLTQISLANTNMANNNTYELTYTPTTGSLNFLINDVSFLTASDTTYTANLSPMYGLHWLTNGGTGIIDYTPTFYNTTPATFIVGKTASNTSSAPQLVWSNGGEIGWIGSGYVSNKSGKITQATLGISDWNTSTSLKIIPYDSNLNRIGTSVATFTSSQGSGIVTAQFDTPFDVIKGQTYYLGIAPNGYISLLGDASNSIGFGRMTSATGYNSPPSTLTSAGGGSIYEPTNFLSGYPIPAAMRMYANSAVKVTNIVEAPSITSTFNFDETDGTKLQDINPAFYVSAGTMQTLTGNLVSVGTGGNTKMVYRKGFGANQASQVTKPNSNNRSFWVSVHSNTTTNDDGYSLYIRTYPNAELYREGSWIAGPYTLSANAVENTVTAKIESVLQANGSLIINSYYNGSSIGSYTDNYPLQVGKPAFWCSTNAGNVSSDIISQFVAVGEAPKQQLYANGTFVVGEYIEN